MSGEPYPALDLRGEPAELRRLVGWIGEVVERHALSEQLCQRLELALDEAVTNVVLYAAGPHGEAHIRLTARYHADTLSIELRDRGPAFDPLGAPEPGRPASLEEAPIGGLGIHLMRRASDGLRYRREGEQNVLTLEFRERR